MSFQRLNSTHRDVIERLLSGEETIEQIALSVKKSRRTIHNWMNDPLFKAEYEEREAEFRRVQKARITQLAAKAIDTQSSIMDNSKNDKARADVASDVLDRAGYIKIKKADTKENEEKTGGVVILAEIKEGGTINE